MAQSVSQSGIHITDTRLNAYTRTGTRIHTQLKAVKEAGIIIERFSPSLLFPLLFLNLSRKNFFFIQLANSPPLPFLLQKKKKKNFFLSSAQFTSH